MCARLLLCGRMTFACVHCFRLLSLMKFACVHCGRHGPYLPQYLPLDLAMVVSATRHGPYLWRITWAVSHGPYHMGRICHNESTIKYRDKRRCSRR